MGHEALDAPEIRDAVRRRFGAGAFRADGSLDRAEVARIVFADPARLAELEAIVHPHVARSLERRLAAPAAAGTRAVVIDCALLFEGGLDRLCDATVCVHSDRSIRAGRVLAARGWSDAELARREASQLSADAKRARADRVLVNDGDEESLREAASALLADAEAGRLAERLAGPAARRKRDEEDGRSGRRRDPSAPRAPGPEGTER